MTPEDLLGRRFGSLVVREIAFRREHWSRTEYYCDCDCLNVCEKTGAILERQGKRAGCKECMEGVLGKEPGYVPTPEEIRLECAEIRKGWSANELASRYCRAPVWITPTVKEPRV
jgi:hypothetical protein